MREGLAVGVGGDGYLWMTGDTSTVSSDAEVILADTWGGDASLQLRTLRGCFALLPSDGTGSPAHNAWVQRSNKLRGQLSGTDGTCSREQDNEGGSYLWGEQDNASSVFRCAGDDPQRALSHDAFAYDAVLAVAYALHDLIEIQNKTEVVGSELLDALTSRVRFEGVTGIVDFYDASGDPSRLYHGDRRVGVSYAL